MKTQRQIINEKRAERNRKRRIAYLNLKHREKGKSKKTYSETFRVRKNILTDDRMPLSIEQRSFSINDQPTLNIWQKLIRWIKSLWRG